MAHNSLYPGFVKLYYTQNLIQHVMTLPCSPAPGWQVGVMPLVSPKTGADITLATAVDALVAVLRPLLTPTTTLDAAEAWFMSTVTSDPVWVFTHPIGLVGTGLATVSNMGQMVISFRTFLGGLYRFYLMEPMSSIAPNVRTGWPFGAGVTKNLADYLIGGTGWVIGRDGASLVVPIWYTTKINDALRKKRLLL